MSVPFLDLRAAYLELKDEIDTAVAAVLDGGWYIGGEPIERFESEFATYCEAAHCVGTGNGLDALILALEALEIGPGDEVIVPSHTFIATWLAVSRSGATPVPVEPDPVTRNIEPALIEAAITPRTKAIMPVHLYGLPADLDPILATAASHGLKVIEDAAQAHGARYRGKRIGAHGDVVCWSFYPGKNLGAMGDGGAVTTDDETLAKRIREIGNYGSSAKYVHARQGVNSRLDTLQAAVLSVKLRHLDDWNDRRCAIADFYCETLASSGLKLPARPNWAEQVWHLFVVESDRREALQSALGAKDIGSLIHYPKACHLQGAYRELALPAGSFPLAEKLAATVVSLPIGPQLATEDARLVADALATEKW